MGLAVLDDPDAQYGSFQQFSIAFSALPSPANIAGHLISPALSRNISYSDQVNDGIPDGDTIPAIPGHIRCDPVMSPMPNDVVASDMNLVVGGALAPVQTAPLRPAAPPALPKPGAGLRLPSFEQLGIAAPHPDRVRVAGKDCVPISSVVNGVHEPVRSASDTSQLLPAVGSVGIRTNIPDELFNPEMERSAGRATQSSIHQYVNTITPPSEGNAPDWRQSATVGIAGMHSPPTDPQNVTSGAEEIETAAITNVNTENAVDEDDEVMPDVTELSWIDGAVDVLLGNLRTAARPTNSLKILSHALPSTSPSGHVFGQVISAIHTSTPVSPITPLTWINVFHAIPGRFNLADVPTSPPNTPGPPIGGDDYFTQKVFDSAVSILDYQDDLTSLPRSPRPVVPPSSIDVSIVERYIPPSTSHEFAQMFDPNGSSILVDRLVELSPENGSLLFIYPTRTGAQTFMRDYLSPILDPILRTLVVVHGLSTELCILLGNMTTVPQLLEYGSLQQRIVALCNSLTQRETAAQRLHGRRPVFSLSYSSKQNVTVPRGAWAREWWTKQEKTRLKQTIDSHYQESQPRRRSMNEYGPQSASPTVLLQQLLDGVAGATKQNLEEPAQGIEVGVFVITRSE